MWLGRIWLHHGVGEEGGASGGVNAKARRGPEVIYLAMRVPPTLSDLLGLGEA
ncbi:MAG TPA: hypothetical protein VGG14_02400 [Candidatus Sulfotelmatobacter sp.]